MGQVEPNNTAFILGKLPIGCTIDKKYRSVNGITEGARLGR